MAENPTPYYADDEITLKELILKLQEYWRYLWARKWYLIGAGLLMAVLFVGRAYLKPTTYTASLTFMVNEDDGGNLGGAAAILGQFGLGGGAASEYNLDKIVSLARSRRIVQEALFERVEIKEENDYLANHLIRIYDWHEAWEKDTLLQGFLFTRDSLPAFSRKEKRVLQSMYGQVVGNPDENIEGLLSASYQEETGILSLRAKTEQEQLSIVLAEVLYDRLSTFYIRQSTEKQQITVGNLQERSDSVEQLLEQKEYQLAQLRDNSQGFQLRRDQLREQRLRREVQVMTILLGEILKKPQYFGVPAQKRHPLLSGGGYAAGPPPPFLQRLPEASGDRWFSGGLFVGFVFYRAEDLWGDDGGGGVGSKLNSVGEEKLSSRPDYFTNIMNDQPVLFDLKAIYHKGA